MMIIAGCLLAAAKRPKKVAMGFARVCPLAVIIFILGARRPAPQPRFVGKHCVGNRNDDTCCWIRTLFGSTVDRKTHSMRAHRSLSSSKYFDDN
jgi:hypothetical protein